MAENNQHNENPEPQSAEVVSDWDEVELFPTFDGMGLEAELLKGIYSRGLEKPSPVQQVSVLFSICLA